MYLKYHSIIKLFFKYRYLDFGIFTELLNNKKRGDVIFLQIGASDGLTNDPIYHVVKKYGWRGTLIEPLPHIFEQLKKNYSACNNLHYLNVAVSEKKGIFDIYYLPAEHVEEEWQKQLASFDRKSIEFNLRNHTDLIKKIETLQVPAETLSTIFSNIAEPHTDLLVIDVEGQEYKILKQLDHILNKPDFIFFEKGTMPKEELKALHASLVGWGYKIYSCGPDDLAVRNFKRKII